MRILCGFLMLLFLPACLTHKDIRKKAESKGEDVKAVEKHTSASAGSLEKELSAKKELSSAGGGLSQKLSHIEAGIRELRGELESQNKAQTDRIDQIEQGLSAVIKALNLPVAGLTDGQKKTVKKSVKKHIAFEKAEKFFKTENWKSAIVHYEKYRAQNKKGEFYGRATLQIGLCFQKLKMQKEAKVFFREVVSSFPKSAVAKEAKQKLAGLQKPSGDSSPAQNPPAGAVSKKAGAVPKK